MITVRKAMRGVCLGFILGGPLLLTGPLLAAGFGNQAFRYEEYAWAKANGRVDKDPGLIGGVRRSQEGYFGTEYNRLYTKDTYLNPVVQDRLPLPQLSSAPTMNGQLDDACWSAASRGSARVAFPDEDRSSALAEYSIWAGRYQGWLYLAFQTDRPERGSAVISTAVSGRGNLTLDEAGKARLEWVKERDRQGVKLVDVSFPARSARFVRVDLQENTGSPGVDELEIFGPKSDQNLALQTNGAKATASSCLSGYPQHKIEHLNDGQYGNNRSWIAVGDKNEWVQIELAQPAEISLVRFSRDRTGAFGDRLPIRGRVQVSLDGKTWAVAGAFPAAAVPERKFDLVSSRNASATVWEVGVPLEAIPGWERGVQIEVGVGGQHLGNDHGRPVRFIPSRWSMAQEGPCASGVFKVRVSVAKDGGTALALRGNAPALEPGLTLAAGESRTIEIPAKPSALGQEFDLTLAESGRSPDYELHLFQYDLFGHVLTLLDDMIARRAHQGVKVDQERTHLAKLRQRHAQLQSQPARDVEAERAACQEARLLKRQLFFRDPDLAVISKILFVKRHAFLPSHNYSAQLDAQFNGGGGIYRLDIPTDGDRLVPESAQLAELFQAGAGIADTPMADFDVSKIYFCYRKSREEYWHLMRINPDGGGLQTITDGYYHDTWPCPLPDGGLAFLSTRIGLRFLCWRPQSFVLYRMEADGSGMRPLSYANLSEWGPSVMSDGRIIWTRSEYLDKGANFGHTLWSIRPDGTMPELVFGNGIMQPSGYANGRPVPGTAEVSCTMISHFGDLNGPIAVCDTAKGRFNPDAISNLTPEVLSVGNPTPSQECFRESVPLSKDLFLVAHAPRTRFGLYVIDRYGNREHLYSDNTIESLCPTPLHTVPRPPVLGGSLVEAEVDYGVLTLQDVYSGLEPAVKRGTIKYIRIMEEVASELERLPDGKCREDHPEFLEWYATPVHRVNGPFGWPSFVAKASHGIVPVAEDGSATFYAPARKVLYFQALDQDLTEVQRMRSVVQLQPGEHRSCVGCHEDRRTAPRFANRRPTGAPVKPQLMAWEGKPLSFERDVQPVLDRNCVSCHDAQDKDGINLAATLDSGKVPASYRTLIQKGLVHYADMSWEMGGLAIVPPYSVGSSKSKLVHLLAKGHHDVHLSTDDWRRIKTWIDSNCPLWPDYRDQRPPTGVLAENVR